MMTREEFITSKITLDIFDIADILTAALLLGVMLIGSAVLVAMLFMM